MFSVSLGQRPRIQIVLALRATTPAPVAIEALQRWVTAGGDAPGWHETAPLALDT